MMAATRAAEHADENAGISGAALMGRLPAKPVAKARQ
jgi:hypothetical protein